MWQKRHSLTVCIWFQEWAHLGPEPTVPMHPQLRPFTWQLFLDICVIFFPEWPLIFLVSTIHQVIWPSPGTLPDSGDWDSDWGKAWKLKLTPHLKNTAWHRLLPQAVQSELEPPGAYRILLGFSRGCNEWGSHSCESPKNWLRVRISNGERSIGAVQEQNVTWVNVSDWTAAASRQEAETRVHADTCQWRKKEKETKRINMQK